MGQSRPLVQDLTAARTTESAVAESVSNSFGQVPAEMRYAPYRSYVLLASPPIQPISVHILDQFPLGKAQRLDR